MLHIVLKFLVKCNRTPGAYLFIPNSEAEVNAVFEKLNYRKLLVK